MIDQNIASGGMGGFDLSLISTLIQSAFTLLGAYLAPTIKNFIESKIKNNDLTTKSDLHFLVDTCVRIAINQVEKMTENYKKENPNSTTPLMSKSDKLASAIDIANALIFNKTGSCVEPKILESHIESTLSELKPIRFINSSFETSDGVDK